MNLQDPGGRGFPRLVGLVLIATSIGLTPCDTTPDVPTALRFSRLRSFGDHVWSLDFSMDGKRLACGGRWTSNLSLWEVATGKRTQDYSLENAEGVNHVSLSPDGQFLAASYKLRGLVLWDLSSERQVSVPRELETRSSAYAKFSPDSKTLAVKGDDGSTLELWHASSLRRSRILGPHAGGLFCFSFSPDGKSVAVSERGRRIRWWDVSDGRELSAVDTEDNVKVLAFSPDGRSLAWSSGSNATVVVWDLGKRRRINTLEHVNAMVSDLAFSPNGEVLVSTSRGGVPLARNAKVWEFRTGRVLQTLPWNGGMLWDAAFSRDGTVLALGGEGGVTLWGLKGMVEQGNLRDPRRS